MDSSATEEDFGRHVDGLVVAPDASGQLLTLLEETHPVYDGRGAGPVARMRGWVLVSLAEIGVNDEALVYVLEELDAGMEPYLVAAAARALRSADGPAPAFTPFVLGAVANVRLHDELVSFDHYGAVGDSPDHHLTVVGQLLRTLSWLGPAARNHLAEVEALTGPGGLPKTRWAEVRQAIDAIDQGSEPGSELGSGSESESESESESVEGDAASCCHSLGRDEIALGDRMAGAGAEGPLGDLVLEDHDGDSLTFAEFFEGQPTVAVFFYTRCDNPLKCSLTVTKLARVQMLLETRGLADRIQTAAITYDPDYDGPDRLRRYGEDRGVRLAAGHRMLRAPGGIEPIRRHFELGVNFVESLVNRHRIEVYLLDAAGRIASSFQRLRWDESEVVDRAEHLLHEMT